mmetsp:Transcript_31297/g.84927  ORF Transcript_31297/g.84927 Transcript_31297/m.84927 type:complete len:234 (+) Transcript_31297:209-910(+)
MAALHLPHDCPHFPVDGPRLLQDSDQVDAPRHALEALAAHNEGLDAHLFALSLIQDVKESAGVEGIKLLSLKVGLDLIVLEVALELAPTDMPRSIGVGLLEYPLHLDKEGLVALQLTLNNEVLVQAAQFASSLHEDASEDIHDSDDNKHDVECHQPTVDHRYLLQWLDDVCPTHAVDNRCEQCVHRVGDGAVPRHHAIGDAAAGHRPVLVMLIEVHDGTLHEDDRKQVHDDEQ